MQMATEGALELDASFFADPHALYARLREQRPVLPVVTPAGLRVWLVTRYDDVRDALSDPRLGKDSTRFSDVLERHLVDPNNRVFFADAINKHMLSSDPPDHTRLRRLVSKAFTARSIAGLRPRIEEIAQDLVEVMARRVRAGERELDLIDAFAFPLPMTVIAEILGVPDQDRDSFRVWSNTLLSQAPAEQRESAALSMARYLGRLVEEKLARPADDMLSVIVSATDVSGTAVPATDVSGTDVSATDVPATDSDSDGSGDDRLSGPEAVSMAFLLLVAGHETTVNLIGNGMLALLRQPERMAQLRSHPELTGRAVEEFLRFDGPLNTATFRHTLEPVTFSGVDIPADELVLVSLTSANRDATRYPHPDELDLTRDTGQHLAFGHGIHFCLGAALARLEGEIAFRTLLGRFADIELAADPAVLAWRSSMILHGLDRLPVRLSQ